MQEPAGLLSIEDELDDFRGFPLGSGEFPLCNRIGCGVDQNRIPAQNSRALDATIRSDKASTRTMPWMCIFFASSGYAGVTRVATLRSEEPEAGLS